MREATVRRVFISQENLNLLKETNELIPEQAYDVNGVVYRAFSTSEFYDDVYGANLVILTQSEYDAIVTKNPNTLYHIKE